MSSTESAVVALPDDQATRDLGARLFEPLAGRAQQQAGGALLTLDGPLGAGKSALARAMLRAAGVVGPIPSPTFTLVEPYECDGLTCYHLDLYRLSEPEELMLIGYPGMRRQGVLRVVEWAQRLPAALGPADLAVALDYDGAGRRAILRGDAVLQQLAIQ